MSKEQLDLYRKVFELSDSNPGLEIITTVPAESINEDGANGFAEIFKVEIGNWYEHCVGHDCIVYEDKDEIMELVIESIFNDYPDFSDARIEALAERVFQESVKKVIYVRTCALLFY